MARKLYPLPVAELVANPGFIAMDSAPSGLLFQLLLHFWKTECRPLPKGDHQLQAIARAHRPTWVNHRASVLKAFEEVRPSLEAYWQDRERKRTTIIFAGDRARANQRAQALAKSHPSQGTLSQLIPIRNQSTPKPAAKSVQTSAKPRMVDRL